MNGTTLRTVARIAASINSACCLSAAAIGALEVKWLVVVWTVITIATNWVVDAVTTYYNNDYTDTAREYTGRMRYAKELNDEEFVGETYDSGMEDEDDE